MNDKPTGVLKYKVSIPSMGIFYCNKVSFRYGGDRTEMVLHDAYPSDGSQYRDVPPITVKTTEDYTYYDLPTCQWSVPLYWQLLEEPIKEMAGEK